MLLNSYSKWVTTEKTRTQFACDGTSYENYHSHEVQVARMDVNSLYTFANKSSIAREKLL